MVAIKKNKLNKEVYRNFALITQLGISMIVPVFLLLALGIFLENKYGIFTTLPCLIIGILAGCRNTYRLAVAANKKSDDEKSNKSDEKIVDEAVKEWNDGRQFTNKK
jgi:ATP synthase protein I